MILEVIDDVLEGTDNWNVAAIAVPRANFTNPVLITQSDVSGLIALNVYPQNSSTPVYTTSFAKTLMQDGVTEAIHPALVDSRWQGEDAIGHNFVHKIRETDIGAGILRGGRDFTFVYTIPLAQDGNFYAIFRWKMHARH